MDTTQEDFVQGMTEVFETYISCAKKDVILNCLSWAEGYVLRCQKEYNKISNRSGDASQSGEMIQWLHELAEIREAQALTGFKRKFDESAITIPASSPSSATESGQPQVQEQKTSNAAGRKRLRSQPQPFLEKAAYYQGEKENSVVLLAASTRWDAVARMVLEKMTRMDEPATTSKTRVDRIEDQVLYFCQVFGKAGMKRLSDFVKAVRQSQQDGAATWTRSESQGASDNGSVALWDWIRSVELQDQTYTDELGATLKRYLHGYRQYQSYQKLLNNAEDPGTETYQKMHRLGFTNGPGRDVRTNVKAYFLHITRGFSIEDATAKQKDMKDPELKQARKKLQNSIETGSTYYKLTQTWSIAVFSLLPDHPPSHFCYWPKANLKIVVETIAELIPETKVYCDKLLEAVVAPFQTGQVFRNLPLEAPKKVLNKGLLELITPTDPVDPNIKPEGDSDDVAMGDSV